MRLDGEETFFGESIETPEEFIEDLCERVNTGYSTAMDEKDKMNEIDDRKLLSSFPLLKKFIFNYDLTS